jgi:hypothetical protein
LAKWNAFKTDELPVLNRELPSPTPQIRLDLPPKQQETGENEE